MKIITWTIVVTGVIALPWLIKKRWDDLEKRSVNIRYDTNDTLFELEA
jgi:hypothetical protein